MKQPFASLVIPTLNRGDFLYNAMVDMLAQDYPAYEIIVVDQSDNTPDNVKKLTADNSAIIRYFNVSFRGLPQARNFGLSNAKGEIIIFIDDDIRADKSFIGNHLKAYAKDPQIGLIAGGINEPNVSQSKFTGTGVFKKWTATPIAGFESKNACYVDHVKGCNFSVQKAVFQSISGIDEQLNIGAALYEELEFCLRASGNGFKIYFEPTARLTHLVASDGGCRVPNDIPKYMYGLAHNRSLVISRHLSFMHKVSAFGRLFILGLSYSRAAKSIKPLIKTVQGCRAGIKAGKSGPKITSCP
ncbi:glycosyltransferase [Endozoicomonas sp. SESOKO1]|uniref:glycosyltransferase n=1 Tax=Endozoicomonas sp. SESOKO1 TaxID=2828742 RepID=UPI002147BD39|nr:glycosyltransferase [Endozoicomonas sp. SESOKO1]